MKKLKIIIFKGAAIALLIGVCLDARAQKLPNVQSVSISAPADIKIDGNAAEWGNKFQAYNNATELFYTLANDTENLYLTMQSNNPGTIQKIVAGGITFTLKNSDKKSTITPVSITYPMVIRQYTSGVSSILKNNPGDTDIIALNKQISGHIKEISITGIKEIPDSSVSVYNELGIKAAGLVDNQKAYTCELAIPLKYIRQVIDNAGAFKYNIQVNGLSSKGGFKVLGGVNTNSNPQDVAVDHGSSLFLISPTYFSGEYTLVKKL